jgi:hypothetical protein
MIRKVTAQLNIVLPSFWLLLYGPRTAANQVITLSAACRNHFPLHFHQAENAGNDQIQGDNIIEQSWNHQNENSGNQCDQRLQPNVKLHQRFSFRFTAFLEHSSSC